jgi:hypothetical protein
MTVNSLKARNNFTMTNSSTCTRLVVFFIFFSFSYVSLADIATEYPECITTDTQFQFRHQGAKSIKKRICISPLVQKTPWMDKILNLDIDFEKEPILTAYVTIKVGPARKTVRQLLSDLDLREKELNYIYGKTNKDAKQESFSFFDFFTDEDDKSDDKNDVNADTMDTKVDLDRTEEEIIEECTTMALNNHISAEKLNQLQDSSEIEPVIDLGKVDFQIHLQANNNSRRSEPLAYTTVSFLLNKSFVSFSQAPSTVLEKKRNKYIFITEYKINLFESLTDKIIKAKKACLEENHSKIQQIRKLLRLGNTRPRK